MICKPPYFIKLKQNICNNYQNVSKHFQRQWLNWLNSREREMTRDTGVTEKERERVSICCSGETLLRLLSVSANRKQVTLPEMFPQWHTMEK